MTRRKAVTAPALEPFVLRDGHALVLRTCAPNLTSYNGFQWPEFGAVEAPDWNPRVECGHGLHGLLWGIGDGSLLNWDADARWLVVDVLAADVVEIGAKVKFPRCEVVFCGARDAAVAMLIAHGADPTRVIAGTATAGYAGTATAGDAGTATAGDYGRGLRHGHGRGRRHGHGRGSREHRHPLLGREESTPPIPHRLHRRGRARTERSVQTRRRRQVCPPDGRRCEVTRFLDDRTLLDIRTAAARLLARIEEASDAS